MTTPYEETLDALCQLLQTGDEADRCYASRALGSLGDPAAVERLIPCLRDEDLDVAIDAAEALGRIGHSSAIPPLLESLQNDPSGEVCTMIARALGRIGGSEASGDLLRMATQRPEYMEWDDDWDTWWDVQRESVRALGMLGATEAIDSLLQLLDDDEQQDIEVDILNALIRISAQGEAQVIERLQQQDSPSLTRRRAANALARSTRSESTRALGRALTDPAADVRAAAALALAEKNTPAYINALTLLLRDPAQEVRQAAIKAITHLAQHNSDMQGIQQAFQDMLADSDSNVRATLFETLLPAVTGHPLSAENFATVLHNTTDPSAETAAAACTLLGANGNCDALPKLLDILADTRSHPMVRREAATAIGELGQIDARILGTLETTVSDEQQPVRLAALSALMQLHNHGRVIAELPEADQPLPSPMQIVVDALHGKITDAQDDPAPPAEITLNTQVATSAAPEELVEDKTPELPETAAEILAEGESGPVMSTLDAIALANVETLLGAPAAEPDSLDESTGEYLSIVEDNKEIMARMRSNRRIDTHSDIRRLAARVLAESHQPEAVDSLILALSDDDMIVRREAAAAIGIMARDGAQLPRLMDALGILMTQLALSDLDQQITAARALGHLGNRAALAPLMEATDNPQATLRIAGIEALVQLSLHSQDPEQADHMVVRNIPPLSIARKLLEHLQDADIGVRVAAAKGLGQLLQPLDEEPFTRKAVQQIIASTTVGSGEEARLLGQALRQFDTTLANELLLQHLQQAGDSVKRSVFIEMLEELLSGRQPSGRAA